MWTAGMAYHVSYLTYSQVCPTIELSGYGRVLINLPGEHIMKSSALNVIVKASRDNHAVIPSLPTEPAPIKAKVSSRAYVVATPFQVAVFDSAFDHGDMLFNIIETARARMLAIVSKQYGTTSPTYEQFKEDRSAFTALALERGLVDDQVIRKPYCAAIVQLFGKLPVSDSPAAVAKRLQRPVKLAVVKTEKPAKVDTPPAERNAPSADEIIGQLVALKGPGFVLAAVAKILATVKATELDAKTLLAVASHYKPAKVA